MNKKDWQNKYYSTIFCISVRKDMFPGFCVCYGNDVMRHNVDYKHKKETDKI